MSKRRQLGTNAQRLRLRGYIRTLRANYNRAAAEIYKIFRVRKACPLEQKLRYRRFDEASQLLKLAEACLAEVNHCYALRLAVHQPGDHIVVNVVVPGYSRPPTRYIVLDVLWQKGDQYHYSVQELTKHGKVHGRRYPTWLWPSRRVSIEYSDQPLAPEVASLAEGRRAASKQFLAAILQEGDLSIFAPAQPVKPEPPTRQYPYWIHHY